VAKIQTVAALTVPSRPAADGTPRVPPAPARASAPPAAWVGRVKAALVGLVLGEVANLSGAADVAPDAPLMSAGLTSALALQLVAALEGAVGAELPGTLVFDYPTGVASDCTSALAWPCLRGDVNAMLRPDLVTVGLLPITHLLRFLPSCDCRSLRNR